MDATLRRILIVDDSEVIRNRLHDLVCDLRRGVEVTMARDVQQALRMLQSEQPDIVTLDLRMPDGSGLDVLREIKSRYPGTLVAIVTNYPLDAYRARCAELGADYFFDKATEFENLRSALQLRLDP